MYRKERGGYAKHATLRSPRNLRALCDTILNIEQ